jgi:hypothetical protein
MRPVRSVARWRAAVVGWPLAVAALLVAGCGIAPMPIVSRGCLQTIGDPGRASTLHLVKAGQLVPDDSLLVATEDDPEAHRLAQLARRHAVAAVVLGISGVVLTIVGVSVTTDGARGPSTPELAVGAPMAGVGIGALIAGGVEIHKMRARGVRAFELYNERHPDCR